MTNGPKIGLIDIETAPLEAFAWGLFDQNIGLNQIKREWAILSYCYKPLGGGRKTIEYKDNRDRDPLDDTALVHRLWEIMHENDVLIAQNGKRFDMRKMRARMVLLNMPPPSPVKIEDTMLMARKVAAFTSNKLEWLSTYLSTVKKSKHKEFPGFELWAECLKGNPAAWVAMEKYNIPDVLSMEEVYIRLRPWAGTQTNVAVYTDGTTPACPCCGSTKMQQDGYSYTKVSQYLRYVCKGCGAWSRGRYTINTLAKRRSLLAA